MSTIVHPHTRVAVGVSRTSISKVIARALAVQAGVAAEPQEFPGANPTPAALLMQIQALQAAQQRTTARQPGAAADRNAAAAVVMTSLGEIRTYVQGLCDASPEKAAQLVAAASMKIVVSKRVPKPVIAATLAIASGTVVLRANKHTLLGKTAVVCTFFWEYSLDGQKTWLAAPATPSPETTITGLPPLATVSFRVSASTRKLAGAFCQPVSLLVAH